MDAHKGHCTVEASRDEPGRTGLQSRAGSAQGSASRRRRRCARRYRARSASSLVRLERRDQACRGSADAVEREGRIATVALTPSEHERYYLGYANSVLWPVFHNRLDLAQFEAGYFEQLSRRQQAPRRPAAAAAAARRHHLGARLPSDPVRHRAAQARRAEPHRLLSAHSVPALADVHGHPRARELARGLAAYDLIGLQTKADVAQPHRLHGQWRLRPHRAGRAHPRCSTGWSRSRASPSAST